MRLLEQDPSALQTLLKLGGPELLRQMIRLFLEHTPRRIHAAREGEQVGDWPTIERACHSLKSSAAYLGLTGLQERAAKLEELSAQGGSNEIRTLLREVCDGYPEICGLLLKAIPPQA